MNSPTFHISSVRPKIAVERSDVPSGDDRLQKRAQEFEAVFLTEMLSHTGLAEALAQDAGFGGEAFSQRLIEAYAEQLAQKDVLGVGRAIMDKFRETEK